MGSSPRTLWRRSVTLFCAPQQDRRLFLSVYRKLRSPFPLKHLEQLVDPAGFNLAVRRHFIDEVGQQARQLSARGIGRDAGFARQLAQKITPQACLI